jgi:GNAT superfamily N-acetyltransferase
VAETFEKVPFEWPGDRPAPAAVAPAGARWRAAAETDGFLDLVAASLPTAVDAWHRSAVEALGARRTAELVTTGLTGYSHRADWWQVLHLGDEPAGFVLPAVFDGCARDGLDEATLLLIGVHPRHRGAGLGRVLLRQATATLVEHGVWRIYADTAAANAPMTALFEREGWRRLPPHRRPVHEPPGGSRQA